MPNPFPAKNKILLFESWTIAVPFESDKIDAFMLSSTSVSLKTEPVSYWRTKIGPWPGEIVAPSKEKPNKVTPASPSFAEIVNPSVLSVP